MMPNETGSGSTAPTTSSDEQQQQLQHDLATFLVQSDIKYRHAQPTIPVPMIIRARADGQTAAALASLTGPNAVDWFERLMRAKPDLFHLERPDLESPDLEQPTFGYCIIAAQYYLGNEGLITVAMGEDPPEYTFGRLSILFEVLDGRIGLMVVFWAPDHHVRSHNVVRQILAQHCQPRHV
ncbi:hypothetical protein GGF32_002809 [Allomyces javanicus]|nr:hypothetical protein GGF32_002809 [Allomyces javanicus]